ncbi:tyrosine-type recombinase/integrase [Neobacillus drentensis]|uniref:tyrosine-type recombinase/integrase n=1 Tax=Neobacillus drentensis TaxID=220684 RepID=UPI002FFDB57B
MIKYWEIKKKLPNSENEKVINKFLLNLKNTNRSKSTIIRYRTTLQYFFGEIEILFSSITSNNIQQWLSDHQKDWNEGTIRSRSIALRSFFRYCVEKGYMAIPPIKSKYQGSITEKYWEVKVQLPNIENKRVINEYLLSLKVANRSFYSINNVRYFLQSFFKEQEGLFSSLTSDEIQEWLIQHHKGVKENTIKFHVSALSAFYAFCVEEGYLDKSPVKSRWFPRCPKPIPKYMGKEEIAKIRWISEKGLLRDRAMLEFFLSSGCRVGEVHLLDRASVDLENRTARVVGKGRKIRQVHFSEKCALLLERYLECRKDGNPALFVASGIISSRISSRWIQKIFNRVGNEAGVTGSLHPHRLRHTFATELLAKGADLFFIADELGHSDLKTTQVYANLPKSKVITLYRKYMG